MAFHGTMESFSKNPLQLTDAIFTHGFFINPDISYSMDKSKDIGIQYNGDTYFYPIATNEGLFTSNNIIQSTSVGIKLYEFINGAKKGITSTIKSINPTEPKIEYPKRDILKDNIGASYDEADLQKSIEIGNTIISNGLINLATRGRLKLDTILKYEYVSDNEDINIITLQDIIKQETGADNYDQITVVNENDKSTIKIDISGESYKLEGTRLVTFNDKPNDVVKIKEVISNLIDIITNNNEILMETFGQSKETIDECVASLTITTKLSDLTQIQQNLGEINEKFDDITAWLQSEDEDIYNKLFTC